MIVDRSAEVAAAVVGLVILTVIVVGLLDLLGLGSRRDTHDSEAPKP